MNRPRTLTDKWNGDVMQKPTRKMQIILFTALTILLFILLNPPWSTGGNTGGEKGKKEESLSTTALEKALQQMEGVGEISIYFHPSTVAKEQSPLSDYFMKSEAASTTDVTGVLVVAQGADQPGLKSELTQLLSAVLQLPEHRIVIVEMTKRGNYDENK